MHKDRKCDLGCSGLSMTTIHCHLLCHCLKYESCMQVLCDILRSGGLPGEENGGQPSLFFAADDLEYPVGELEIF